VRPVKGVLVLAALLLAVTGCGGRDDGRTAAAGTPAAASATPTQASDQLLAMARCLREHGVSVPDPRPGQQVLAIPKGDKDTITAAGRECAKYEPKVQTIVRDPAHHDLDLKIAKCLRGLGVDAPDPPAGQPLVVHPHGDVQRMQALHEKCAQRFERSGSGQG
jgi:hypothetical protein